MSPSPQKADAMPPDFEERCRRTNARIEAGEPMTMQYLADELGISFELFALCFARQLQTMAPGMILVIDTAPAKLDG